MMIFRTVAIFLFVVFFAPLRLWAQEQVKSEAPIVSQMEQSNLPQNDEAYQQKILGDKLQVMQNQIELLKSEIAKSKSVEAISPKVPVMDPTLPLSFDQRNLLGLRKRTHSLSWKYRSAFTDGSVSQGNLSSSGNARAGELDFEYKRNFGFAEIGVILGGQNNESSGVKLSNTGFSLGSEFNFIENIPGNDVIPFASFQMGLVGTNIQSNTESYEISGVAVAIGGGLKWFPFSEVFALTLGLKFGAAKMDNVATPKLEVEVRQTELNVGWSIYF